MMSRIFLATVAICCLISTGSLSAQARGPSAQQVEREAWVSRTLEHMETIKPGMTRAELLKAFRWEGGLTTRKSRTYVSRECQYFKVDVEFRVVHLPGEGIFTPTLEHDEWGADVIVTMSKPYIGRFVID